MDVPYKLHQIQYITSGVTCPSFWQYSFNVAGVIIAELFGKNHFHFNVSGTILLNLQTQRVY